MCLEKDPTRRYASAGALAADLEALTRPPSPAAQGPSIAVLPFVNLSPDPQNEYFADGVTEEIITVLSQVKGLRVAARNSSFAFKGAASDLAAVAARLNVGTLLTGSVRAAGGRLRIAVQLVDAANGFQLWSERFDRPQDDVFAIQDEIAAAVASRLQVTLNDSGAEPTVTRAANLDAYHHFLRGRTRFNRRDLGAAAEDLQEAVRLDPEYAPAHALLATVLSVIGFYGIAPGYDVFRRAKRAAQRAIALDASLPDATSAAFFIGIVHDWDWESVDTHFTRVPSQARSSLLLNWHSLYLALILGRTEQAHRGRPGRGGVGSALRFGDCGPAVRIAAGGTVRRGGGGLSPLPRARTDVDGATGARTGAERNRTTGGGAGGAHPDPRGEPGHQHHRGGYHRRARGTRRHQASVGAVRQPARAGADRLRAAFEHGRGCGLPWQDRRGVRVAGTGVS